MLVNIAINLSLGESIILVPITPAALHPNPIHINNACLPHAEHFLKTVSKLKAILGKYPISSKNVNKGKNIAIGGNITAITHARTLNTPSTNISYSQTGELIEIKNSINISPILNRKSDSI